MDLGDRVDPTDPRLQGVEFGWGGQIGLVEQDHVGEGELLHRLVAAVEVLRQMLGVGDRDNGIEAEGGAHVVVGEEGLGDGRRVGEAGGLDQDAIEAVLALEQPAEDPDQVAAHRAADAAVVHLEELLFARDHQLVVHADLPELVFDHRQLAAVLFGEDAVEQRRLAGAEKAGEDGDGNGG